MPSTLTPAITLARPNASPPGPLSPTIPSARPNSAPSGPLTSSQLINESHRGFAAGPLTADQPRCEAHTPFVGGNLSASQRHRGPHDHAASAELLFHAEMLSDIEGLRIATENRARSMRDVHGLDTSDYQAQMDALAAIEHQATLSLQRALRRHPLGPWVKRTVGIGEKQGARLIAAIGDPYWNALEDRPRRGPAELWAYCGYVPGQKRRKGEKSNWSAQAKMRAFLVAESCIKQAHSPYRAVYDQARAHKAEMIHDAPCQICAGKGKPADAAIGTPWRDGHKHTHALRLVAKAILRDLFLEARSAATG